MRKNVIHTFNKHILRNILIYELYKYIIITIINV